MSAVGVEAVGRDAADGTPPLVPPAARTPLTEPVAGSIGAIA